MSRGFRRSAGATARSDALGSGSSAPARAKCLRCLLGGAATLTLGLFAIAPAAIPPPATQANVAAAPASAIEDIPSLPDLPPADAIAPEVSAPEATVDALAEESPPPAEAGP